MPLIIIPTPVGNLEDMTLRGLRELREADVVACEDTRRTLRLLNSYEIKKPLLSCHEHNETSRVEEIMARLERGERVALVSDAGTPGLSDPGWIIAREAAERGYDVDALPGANALLPALLLSKLPMESFLFVGFLDGRTEDKRRRLEEIKRIKDTLVFYISPHRLLKELAFIAETLGNRRAALVREISKVHQESIQGTLLSLCDTIPEEKIRGEFVCVISGAEEDCDEAEESGKWREEACELSKKGETTKDIANALSIKYGIQKNVIKKFLIESTREADQ